MGGDVLCRTTARARNDVRVHALFGVAPAFYTTAHRQVAANQTAMASTESALDPRFVRVLRDLKRCFEAIEGQYAVIGGVAVVLNGYPRYTVDLDVLAMFDFTNLDDFLEMASAFGFEARIPDAVAFARRNYVFLLRHIETDLPVDIALAFTPFEQEIIRRANLVNIGETTISLLTPEDLLIMKCVSQRPIDLIDASELYKMYADQIDLRRVRYWVEQFAEALDEPDLWTRVEPFLQRE